MSYPVDDTFIFHHAILAIRHLRLLVAAAITGCVLAGIFAFINVPVRYQASGIILLDDIRRNHLQYDKLSNAKKLEDFLCREFRRSIGGAGCGDGDVSAVAVSRVISGTAVVDWRISGSNKSLFEKFFKNISVFTEYMQERLASEELIFYVEPVYSHTSDFNSGIQWVLFFAGLGGVAGLFAGFIIAFALSCCDRSIADLQKFEKSYLLMLMGVLPSVENPDDPGVKSLLASESYAAAVDSLRLNVQFCKPASSRAFVVAVCGMTSKCGTTSVALALADSLKASEQRVLVLNKDNCDITVASQLAGRMEEVLSSHSPDFDFIIIDLPDAQSSSVPLIVSKLADAMLLVCDCRNCSSYLLKVTLWRFRKANIKLAGVVVNHFPMLKRRNEFDFYQQLFYHYRG